MTKSVFELHVVRTSDSGAAYEDTVDHLSESEREVTGLVFALAGYLAHEVYEDVPFILLDSLEAIDSGRLAALIDYLTDYTGYLLVALLPEDAAALSDDYERITKICRGPHGPRESTFETPPTRRFFSLVAMFDRRPGALC